ncbi:hypothetical protein B0H13DRAFT_1852511 [Mycena leptocephala]|nr:hypothetical protein B0H13DRAFT_1852511 [Mycena leptocephala]
MPRRIPPQISLSIFGALFNLADSVYTKLRDFSVTGPHTLRYLKNEHLLEAELNHAEVENLEKSFEKHGTSHISIHVSVLDTVLSRASASLDQETSRGNNRNDMGLGLSEAGAEPLGMDDIICYKKKIRQRRLDCNPIWIIRTKNRKRDSDRAANVQAATTSTPRVRGVDEGVNTTPGSPRDTDEEDERSTPMPPRNTGVTDEPENK